MEAVRSLELLAASGPRKLNVRGQIDSSFNARLPPVERRRPTPSNVSPNAGMNVRPELVATSVLDAPVRSVVENASVRVCVGITPSLRRYSSSKLMFVFLNGR